MQYLKCVFEVLKNINVAIKFFANETLGTEVKQFVQQTKSKILVQLKLDSLFDQNRYYDFS
jgi:hypothetical protein